MKKRMYINRLVAVAWIFASLGLACPVFAGDSNTVKYDLDALKEGQSYHGLIITYKTDGAEFYTAGSTESTSADELLKKVHIAVDKAKIIKSGHPLAFHYHRRLASGAHLVRADHALTADEARDLIQQIASDPTVDFVEPEFWLKAADDPVIIGNGQAKPNDPNYYTKQWNYLTPDGASFQYSIKGETVHGGNNGGANIEKAWSLADGYGITIASLDTGITKHPDLRTELADVGYDFISTALHSGRSTDTRAVGAWDMGDWTTEDKYLESNGGCVKPNDPKKQARPSGWHGTSTFGIVGGEATNNGIGLAGVAYRADVLPVRVLGHCGGSNADIADAIIWASGGHVEGVPANTHPAQVLSLSLAGENGACGTRSALELAIADAAQRGTVVVVAAGNADKDVAEFTPANCANVIAVAAVGIAGKRASYSNYGSLITLAAPGGDAINEVDWIWSADNTGETTFDKPTYSGVTGTSAAAPHVAGAVVLLQSYRRALGKALLSPAQVSSLLKSTAKPINEPEAAKPIGAGLLDAYEAVRQAATLP